MLNQYRANLQLTEHGFWVPVIFCLFYKVFTVFTLLPAAYRVSYTTSKTITRETIVSRHSPANRIMSAIFS